MSKSEEKKLEQLTTKRTCSFERLKTPSQAEKPKLGNHETQKPFFLFSISVYQQNMLLKRFSPNTDEKKNPPN